MRHGNVLRAVVALYPDASTLTICKHTGKPSYASTRRALAELQDADMIERMVAPPGQQAHYWRITRGGAQMLATQKAELERNAEMWARMARDIDLYLLAADQQYRRPEQERAS